jgi:ABC-type dipeptide/oligopeptide/nickel transport system permease subunit
MTDATAGVMEVEPRRKRPGLLLRLLGDPLAAAAAAILVLIVLAALLAPWIAPHDPYLTTRRRLLPPVWEARGVWMHVLGTDSLGRDMLSRLLYGARATLTIGLAATVVGGAIGVAVGFAAAFYRRLDGPLMRLNDVLLSMPAILLGLALAAVAGSGLTAIVVALSIATIPTVARVARGSALVVMAQDFMEAGRSIGLPDRTLIWRYLALNCISPVLVYLTLRFAQTILIGAVLSFLGLGAQPPAAELGMMASSGRNELFIAPHVATIPSLAIIVIVLCVNVLGDALRDLLDPKLRKL